MDRSYWHKQTAEKPLFPDLLWSRPENKLQAGKLLIIGGSAHGFAAPASAYVESIKAGIGTARVILPEAVRKLMPKGFFEAEFSPSTPSGSFAKLALGGFLEHAQWADAVMLSGDFGRNSETAIVLEHFAKKYLGPLTITKDALDYFIAAPEAILDRDNTTLVLSFAQLQKLAMNIKSTSAFTFDMDFLYLLESLHVFNSNHQANIIVKHLDTIFVAVDGRICTTKPDTRKVWRVQTAANAAVWLLQNNSKPFEALATAIAHGNNVKDSLS